MPPRSPCHSCTKPTTLQVPSLTATRLSAAAGTSRTAGRKAIQMTENVSAAPVSPDGPVIAFTAWGQGEPLAIIDGATAYPAINPTNEQIGRLRSNEFRTYAYDRRGRGQSTDTAPYAVEREIDDLAALIEVAGGRRRHPAERVLADHGGRRAYDRLRRSDHGNHDVGRPAAP
jgi:hypothetical protein